jgi:drug/metabolite transporter (DMT)-like permease
MLAAADATGVAFALSAMFLWSLSPMLMASVGRRIGSHPTNLLRALLAATILTVLVLPVYTFFTGRISLPQPGQAAWIILSGFAGMVLGDACFYEALVLLGARRAVKINTLAPVFALAIGYLWLGERLTQRSLIGVAMVIAAVMYTAFAEAGRAQHQRGREPGRMTMTGFLFGLGSAFFIALGAVLLSKAFKTATHAPLDRMTATVLRVASAATLLWIMPVITGTAGRVLHHLRDPLIKQRVFIGTMCGPVAGMICYVSSLSLIPAGIVSTLVAASPLVVIPISAIKYRTRIGLDIILAAAIAVTGVALISWE